jgi:hypothetical protein
MRFLAAAVMATLSMAILMGGTNVAGEKIEIKDVMKTAMKGGLCKKVASGKASDDEKKELVKLFTALAAAKPPKGDEASWKAKTKALLSGAKDAAAGKDVSKTLPAAANCAACHKEHKG